MATVLVDAVASTFNLPNYHGPLFMLHQNANVISGLIGSMAPGGGRVIDNYEFGMNTEELPTAQQPEILEGASVPDPTSIGMTHSKNVTQIFDESYGVTYSKTADFGRISGDAGVEHTAGQGVADPDPFSRQALLKLQLVRRQINYTWINGTYQNPDDPTKTARKTRGLLEATDAGNVIAAGGAVLSKDLLDEFFRTLWINGALDNGIPVIFCNAYQKQKISKVYGYAPMDRNVGGVNIKQIETDFGTFMITLERDMPTDTLACFNVGVCSPVYNLVHDPRTGAVKGVFFTEPVPQTKNIYIDHLYGEIGLDHGPGQWHGKITGLQSADA